MSSRVPGVFVKTATCAVILQLAACGQSQQATNRLKNLFEEAAVERVDSFTNVADTERQICSFNVSFLGHWKDKKNDELAAILKPCDVVAIQELDAPPEAIQFPNGENLPADPQAAAFAAAMKAVGFDYVMSPEDTGPTRNHTSTTRSEFFIFFYRSNLVAPIKDGAPQGFVDQTLVNNPTFDRVPYAQAFATLDPYGAKKNDFVLISTHLSTKRQNRTQEEAKLRRKGEIEATWNWIFQQRRNTTERNFFVVGDMNIDNRQELDGILDHDTMQNVTSLNEVGAPTNVAQTNPYDQAMFDAREAHAVIPKFLILNLKKAVQQPDLTTRDFVKYYSDHDPISFSVHLSDDQD